MAKTLTEGSPARLIFAFTMPLILGNIFQQLYAFVDTLLVGRFLGVDALASVGCTGSVLFLITGFVIGLTTGLSIYTGQRFGARDAAGVRQSAAACFCICVGISIILTVLGSLLVRPILLLMQTPPEIIEGAVAFLRPVFLLTVCTVALMMQTNLLRALGDSQRPTIILAVAISINIAMEAFFLLVLQWGVWGAGLAMVLSQGIGALIALGYIALRVPLLHPRREDFCLTWHIIWEHLRIGLPMGFQASIIAIGAVILQVALNGLGPVAIAAYAAAQKVDTIAMMPMMSFGTAMAAYTAQNFGARKFDRIRKGVRQCIYMSVGFSLVAGALIIWAAPFLMQLFVSAKETEVIAGGSLYLTVNGLTYWILSLLFIFRFTLQGLGQSVAPTIAGVMELFMRSTAGIVLVQWLGLLGACLGNPMAWLGSCLPLLIAYTWTVRKFPVMVKNPEI